MRNRIMGILVFSCLFLMACGTSTASRENILEDMQNDSQEESIPIDQESDLEEEDKLTEEVNLEEEKVALGDLVDVESFLKYYQMEENDVPSEYVSQFIQHRQLTEDMLTERNYDKMVKKLYDTGVTFGMKISDLISGEEISLSEEDTFENVAYIVLCKDVNIHATDICEEENVVWEIANQKIYVTQKSVMDDYTTEENVKELSTEDVDKGVRELRELITEEWEEFHSVEDKTYGWQLYIVKDDGTFINYSGEGVDEIHHPGFEEWCQKYFY